MPSGTTSPTREARGWHPRWLHREQSVWTPIGTSNGTHCALMNADGMVEVDQGSFSIEPMLWIEDRLFTWTDVGSRQELLEDWMPVPSVIWESGEWRLRVQAEATVSGTLRVRYRFENLTDHTLSARLFVLVRPFQVTPPWQDFRNLGGVSPIHDLDVARRGGARQRDDADRAADSCLRDSARCVSTRGSSRRTSPRARCPGDAQVQDPFGFASGALEFAMSPQAQRVVRTCAQLHADR